MIGRLLIAALLPLAASAQDRVQHEYIDPGFLRNHRPLANGGTTVEGGDPVPTAVTRDGARLKAPDEDATNTPSFADDAPDRIPRPTEARPDRQTTQDQALSYHAVFNPTVAPMRRNVAFDKVKPDYGLVIGSSARRRVPLSPRTPVAGREMFWGDVKLAVGSGPAPIPSVAPDMRVLAVRTEPPTPVQFSKDAADNFYVSARRKGTVRVVFLVDADSGYFSAPVPSNVPLDTQRDHPAAQLPPRIRAEARQVLKRIGVQPSMPFSAGVDRMVAWFRDFEAGTPPPKDGSIFVDLALGQKGVCRHRAFAFTLAARGAGVPTRQVQNEAHAFVEILAPDGRWRRIDLGGQAPSLDFKNNQNHRLHQPPPDPFAKPERYTEQYSAQLQGTGDPNAPNAPRIGDKPPALGGPGDGASGTGNGPDTGDGGGAGATSGAGFDPEGPLSDKPDAPPIEVPLPAPPDPARPASIPARVAVAVRLDQQAGDYEAFRGEALPFTVSGQLTAADSVPAHLKVQVYLVPEDGGAPRPIGPAVPTDGQGRFTAAVRLPPTLVLGHYRLVVASKESQRFQPGRSDRNPEAP